MALPMGFGLRARLRRMLFWALLLSLMGGASVLLQAGDDDQERPAAWRSFSDAQRARLMAESIAARNGIRGQGAIARLESRIRGVLAQPSPKSVGRLLQRWQGGR